jgi:hypothetical protein
MSQSNSLNINLVIPAKAGIQIKIKASAQPTKNTDVPLRGVFSINWIPAFAGMTELMGSWL